MCPLNVFWNVLYSEHFCCGWSSWSITNGQHITLPYVYWLNCWSAYKGFLVIGNHKYVRTLTSAQSSRMAQFRIHSPPSLLHRLEWNRVFGGQWTVFLQSCQLSCQMFSQFILFLSSAFQHILVPIVLLQWHVQWHVQERSSTLALSRVDNCHLVVLRMYLIAELN